jgi:SPP1 family predicted phage head-tail adaptor
MAPLSKPGQMRHRITVQEYVETTDPNTGVKTRSWSNKSGMVDIPAAVRPLTSREQQAAAARNSEVEVEFELRADFAITAKDRILFEGENWELEPPQYDETRKRRIKIKAKRGMTDG